MAKVIWSPSALDDVDAIAAYIARDSADQASLFVSRLVQAVERLEQFPMSGHVIPEIGDEHCRQVIVASYRIMYRWRLMPYGSPALFTAPAISPPISSNPTQPAATCSASAVIDGR